MNLKNQQVIFKNGTIHTVHEHDKYLHINVDGVDKIYDYQISFRYNCMHALNPNTQSKILQEFEEEDQILQQQRKERIFKKNLQSYINKIKKYKNAKKYKKVNFDQLINIYNNLYN